ncbi:Hypothetical_protein [Hexamita inflata]|uniref:Hypothetical_protein n=1 Tax=Hexamita inflata TaxID=28002 RepID=A0AA86PCJ1_9EUKA|nr:Hypothetical protein HINF_LOCUS21037 [Hexamita inflata]
MLYKQGCCPLLQKSNKRCCVLTFLCMMFAIILIAGIALGVIGYQYETVEYSPIGDSFASFYVRDNVTMFIGICVGTILAIIGFFGFFGHLFLLHQQRNGIRRTASQRKRES